MTTSVYLPFVMKSNDSVDRESKIVSRSGAKQKEYQKCVQMCNYIKRDPPHTLIFIYHQCLQVCAKLHPISRDKKS